MEGRFTVYTWYEKNNRIQQSNFRRWNRRLKDNRESYEVIVFYSEDTARIEARKYENLRFWRLHKDMNGAASGLLNEALRYARSEILVYVSPAVMARNIDLYRLANRVRSDYLLVWLEPEKGIAPVSHGWLRKLTQKISWYFLLGRHEMYARQNHPYDFYKASFFATRRGALQEMLKSASVYEREEIFRNDQTAGGYLNYFLFHLISKTSGEVFNEGAASSLDFGTDRLPVFYSYRNTWRLLRLIFKTGNFQYPLNTYRVLLPLMQITQISFFVMVWFYPWKSLNLLAFYGILGSSLLTDVFITKRKYSPLLIPLWFFSWLLA